MNEDEMIIELTATISMLNKHIEWLKKTVDRKNRLLAKITSRRNKLVAEMRRLEKEKENQPQ